MMTSTFVRSALTNSQIWNTAPSVFATEPHDRVSNRYGFAPTIELVEAFREEGWFPVQVSQSRSRDPSRHEFTRHLIRFNRVLEPLVLGDSVAELVLLNSHDGSSSYQIYAGLYRVLCSNGMVVQEGHGADIRVRHSQKAIQQAVTATYQLVDRLPEIEASLARFRSIDLSGEEQIIFAEASLTVRYGENWRATSPIMPHSLLQTRRLADAEPSLWSVFNRVQENLMKGGLGGYSITGRQVVTRPIGSVSENVRVNRALWSLANRLHQLKTA